MATLTWDAELGRALFYSAIDPVITDPDGGVACASCHDEGRTDGLTWNFTGEARQTPSLAGGLFGTAPYGWMGEIPPVGEVAARTSSASRAARALGPARRRPAP
jgi:hypothetical protein